MLVEGLGLGAAFLLFEGQPAEPRRDRREAPDPFVRPVHLAIQRGDPAFDAPHLRFRRQILPALVAAVLDARRGLGLVVHQAAAARFEERTCIGTGKCVSGTFELVTLDGVGGRASTAASNCGGTRGERRSVASIASASSRVMFTFTKLASAQQGVVQVRQSTALAAKLRLM